MRLTTITFPAIEMTYEEEEALWNTPRGEKYALGMHVEGWNTDDGNNLILLEGEDRYRHIIRTPGYPKGHPTEYTHFTVAMDESACGGARGQPFGLVGTTDKSKVTCPLCLKTITP